MIIKSHICLSVWFKMLEKLLKGPDFDFCKPINIQFFHTESDNDSHCFVLWASTYITHRDKSEFMGWVKMLQKFHPISLSVQSSHNPHSTPRLLDAVVTSERCGSPQFSSNIFLFDTLEGSFTRIHTWLPGKLDHNFVQATDTVLDWNFPDQISEPKTRR